MAPHGSCMAASSTGMGVCRRGSTPQKRSKLPYGLNWRGAGPLSIPVLSLVKVERGSAFRPQRLVFFSLSLSFLHSQRPNQPVRRSALEEPLCFLGLSLSAPYSASVSGLSVCFWIDSRS